jgi:NitT/TauT family transport system substrate-binding protein
MKMATCYNQTLQCSKRNESLCSQNLRPSFWFQIALALVASLAISASTGCNPASNNQTSASANNSEKLQSVKLQLNWFPEAEHGCFYAAKELGYFEEAGLDVEIIPGGKTTVLAQELSLGRVQFAIGNADDVLVAAAQDAPLVAVMASMQHTPRCIMVRADTGIKTFDALKDVTLMLDRSQAYVPYLKSLGYLGETVKIVPYFGSIAPLASEKNYGCQGYSFSEPFLAKQQGIDVNVMSVRDIGFDPYCSLLVTNRDTIAQNPELVRKFVAASKRGLQAYMSQPDQTNKAILAKNSEGMTIEALDYGAAAVGELCKSDDGTALGAMSKERWETFIGQLEKVEFIAKGKLKAENVFTNEFVP